MHFRLKRIIPQMRHVVSIPACIFLMVFFLFVGQCVAADDLVQRIQKKLAPGDATFLASPDGRVLVGINMDEPVIPASTLKLLTALAAIHYLGEDYRYFTDFYIDPESNLIIKGYGDPLMISEEIEKIAARLKRDLHAINDIVVDDRFFEKAIHIAGTMKNSLQPYDAPNGAVCVNFNTVNFKREKNAIVSAERQTPLVPMAKQKIAVLGQASASGRILLTHDHGDIARYAGEMFSFFFTKAGIKISGVIRCGMVDKSRDRLVYRHQSGYDLKEIIARLLEYSNNFIANQLLLTAGAAVSGPPATLDKGVSAMQAYARKKFDLEHLSYVEGSGISRENRITARLFLEILKEFRPYHALMSHQENEYFKTGTLNGISTRVGYLKDLKGNLYMFGVFINTPGKTATPVMAEIRKWNGLLK